MQQFKRGTPITEMKKVNINIQSDTGMPLSGRKNEYKSAYKKTDRKPKVSPALKTQNSCFGSSEGSKKTPGGTKQGLLGRDSSQGDLQPTELLSN